MEPQGIEPWSFQCKWDALPLCYGPFSFSNVFASNWNLVCVLQNCCTYTNTICSSCIRRAWKYVHAWVCVSHASCTPPHNTLQEERNVASVLAQQLEPVWRQMRNQSRQMCLKSNIYTYLLQCTINILLCLIRVLLADAGILQDCRQSLHQRSNLLFTESSVLCGIQQQQNAKV